MKVNFKYYLLNKVSKCLPIKNVNWDVADLFLHRARIIINAKDVYLTQSQCERLIRKIINGNGLFIKEDELKEWSEEEKKWTYFVVHNYHSSTCLNKHRGYDSSPKVEHKDNKYVRVGNGGGGLSSIRYPKKGHKNAWKNFYKIFPHLDPTKPEKVYISPEAQQILNKKKKL